MGAGCGQALTGQILGRWKERPWEGAGPREALGAGLWSCLSWELQPGGWRATDSRPLCRLVPNSTQLQEVPMVSQA